MELCLPQCALLVRSEEVHSIALGVLNSIFHVSINPCHEGVDVILEASSAKGVMKVSGDNCSPMSSMYTMNSCGPRTLLCGTHEVMLQDSEETPSITTV